MCEATFASTVPKLDAVADVKEKNENQSSCSLTFWINGTAWDRCIAVYAQSLRLMSEERLLGPTRYQCMETRRENRQRPESRKAISCKGKISISQYINSEMHAILDMGQ